MKKIKTTTPVLCGNKEIMEKIKERDGKSRYVASVKYILRRNSVTYHVTSEVHSYSLEAIRLLFKKLGP